MIYSFWAVIPVLGHIEHKLLVMTSISGWASDRYYFYLSKDQILYFRDR